MTCVPDLPLSCTFFTFNLDLAPLSKCFLERPKSEKVSGRHYLVLFDNRTFGLCFTQFCWDVLPNEMSERYPSPSVDRSCKTFTLKYTIYHISYILFSLYIYRYTDMIYIDIQQVVYVLLLLLLLLIIYILCILYHISICKYISRHIPNLLHGCHGSLSIGAAYGTRTHPKSTKFTKLIRWIERESSHEHASWSCWSLLFSALVWTV